MGWCEPDFSKIGIWKGAKPDVKATLLKHEVDHVIDQLFPNSKKVEEDGKNIHANGWCMFMKDNPEVILWMLECLSS